jgi:DNA (cytosine-5)-methyltransferase 1
MSQQYKQIGNAVPINLAKEIGHSLVTFLNQYYKNLHDKKKESVTYKKTRSKK